MPLTREISPSTVASSVRYSVCTLMNNREQYEALQASFQSAGFDDDVCEFLFIDNSQQNQCDAFEAMNLFLQEATGEYIILCHQDVRLHDHRIADLDRVINDVAARDPNWAVLGNAGGMAPGRLAIRITDPKGTNTAWGPFPARVDAIDENFMVVKRAANLSLSHDLEGFHFYGTDLCIMADILGYSCWVVDFHLHHIGGESTKKKGDRRNSFHSTYPILRQSLINKYRRAFRPRWLQNTGTILHLSGSKLRQYVLNGKMPVRLMKLSGKISKAFASRAA